MKNVSEVHGAVCALSELCGCIPVRDLQAIIESMLDVEEARTFRSFRTMGVGRRRDLVRDTGNSETTARAEYAQHMRNLILAQRFHYTFKASKEPTS